MTATPVSSIQPALQACNSINRKQFLVLHLSQLISNFAPTALHCTVPLCLSAFAISPHACCQANCLTCALQFEGQALHPYKWGGINRCNFFAAKHLISAGAAPERCCWGSLKGQTSSFAFKNDRLQQLWKSFPAQTEQTQRLANQASNHQLSTQLVAQPHITAACHTCTLPSATRVSVSPISLSWLLVPTVFSSHQFFNRT